MKKAKNDPGLSSAASPDDPNSAIGGMLEAEAMLESEGRIRSGKLAGRTLRSAIWIVALPVLFQQSMAATVGLFDKMLTGSLPELMVVPALDAIGIGSYLNWLIGIAMSGLGIGGQAIIARAMGAGKRGEAQSALGQSLSFALLWGVIVAAAVLLLIDPLASIASLSPEATEYLHTYTGIVALSLPMCGVLMVGSMCLHGAGETVVPAVIMIVVNLVNIVASWLLSGADLAFQSFTITNPTSIDPETYGVIGIAAGTALAYLIGAVLIVVALGRGVKDFKLTLRALFPQGAMLMRIIRVGVPMFIEGVAMWGVNLFVLGFIGIIAVRDATQGGPTTGLIGAHSIAIQWEAFSFMPGFALGTAAGTIAGQYLGAGNPKMASRAIVLCTIAGIVFMGALGVVFIFFGREMTSVISDQPVHLELTPKLLLICGAVQVFFALNMVIRQGLRGVGDTKWTLLITVFSSYGIRLPAAWILGIWMGYGLTGIWIALCGEIVIRGSLFAARFINGGWKHVRV